MIRSRGGLGLISFIVSETPSPPTISVLRSGVLPDPLVNRWSVLSVSDTFCWSWIDYRTTFTEKGQVQWAILFLNLHIRPSLIRRPIILNHISALNYLIHSLSFIVVFGRPNFVQTGAILLVLTNSFSRFQRATHGAFFRGNIRRVDHTCIPLFVVAGVINCGRWLNCFVDLFWKTRRVPQVCLIVLWTLVGSILPTPLYSYTHTAYGYCFDGTTLKVTCCYLACLIYRASCLGIYTPAVPGFILRPTRWCTVYYCSVCGLVHSSIIVTLLYCSLASKNRSSSPFCHIALLYNS